MHILNVVLAGPGSHREARCLGTAGKEQGQKSLELCLTIMMTCSYISMLPSQEMAGRALKQTGSRSIEAALEYISKMGYLDPRNEQIVRVIKQTSPGEPRLAARWMSISGLRTQMVCRMRSGDLASVTR
jgi:hypothetical protein